MEKTNFQKIIISPKRSLVRQNDLIIGFSLIFNNFVKVRVSFSLKISTLIHI